jgi:tetratricopeptide (TPR) repeat protein
MPGRNTKAHAALPTTSCVTKDSKGRCIRCSGREPLLLGRPHGPTILLAESLLSLTRSSRGYISLEDAMEQILEAIGILRTLHADRRLGRAFLDLGLILRDNRNYYDAMSAFDRARQACSAAQDRGGVSASFYNQAFVCRQLRQNIEALQLLTQAESHLPSISFADRWRTQILSERIFNLMGLKRYGEALSHLDTWVSLADGQYTPYLVRGDIYRQRGDLQRALEDYVGAISSLSRNIVSLRTERFQRTDNVRHQPEFDRCLATALEAGESEVALILLELSNTGALGSRHYDIRESDMQVAQQETKLRDRAAGLVPAAVEAAAKRDPRLLAQGQDQADWLVSEWEFLYTEEGLFPSGIQDARKAALQICRTLPEEAVTLHSNRGKWILGS